MKNLKAFTLIELMIVIAIIAILVALLVPAYRDYVEKQRNPDYVAATELTTDQLMEKYVKTYFSPMGEVKIGCIQLLSMRNGERSCTAAFQDGSKETRMVISAVCSEVYHGCGNLSQVKE